MPQVNYERFVVGHRMASDESPITRLWRVCGYSPSWTTVGGAWTSGTNSSPDQRERGGQGQVLVPWITTAVMQSNSGRGNILTGDTR